MADRILVGFFICVAIVAWWASADYPFMSRCIPVGVMTLVTILAVMIGLRPEDAGSFDRAGQIAVFFIITLLSVIIMQAIGFLVATTFFITAAFLVQGIHRIRTILVMTVSSLTLIYFVFIKFFKVPLPTVWQ